MLGSLTHHSLAEWMAHFFFIKSTTKRFFPKSLKFMNSGSETILFQGSLGRLQANPKTHGAKRSGRQGLACPGLLGPEVLPELPAALNFHGLPRFPRKNITKGCSKMAALPKKSKGLSYGGRLNTEVSYGLFTAFLRGVYGR